MQAFRSTLLLYPRTVCRQLQEQVEGVMLRRTRPGFAV